MLGWAAFSVVGLLVLSWGCSSPSPTRNTAERVHELQCRMSAQRYCAAQQGEEVDQYALNQCIGKRAWDCIMGQTPAEQRERYAPEPVAPPEPAD